MAPRWPTFEGLPWVRRNDGAFEGMEGAEYAAFRGLVGRIAADFCR
jgi:hypothetical protein